MKSEIKWIDFCLFQWLVLLFLLGFVSAIVTVQNPIPDQSTDFKTEFSYRIPNSTFNSTNIAKITTSVTIPTKPDWMEVEIRCEMDLVRKYDAHNQVLDLFVAGDLVYLAEITDGLQIVNISDPTNPTSVDGHTTPGSCYGVCVSGNYAYVADDSSGLQIYDISDPTTIVFEGGYLTGERAFGVDVSGDFAYVADRNAGLRVVDVTVPSSPTYEGDYDTPNLARGLFVSGDFCYVADQYTDGLLIFDVSTPSNPTLVGSYDPPGTTYAVYVSEGIAYVAQYVEGLEVVNVTTPSNPTFLGRYNTPGYAYGVCFASDVSGGYAYVADGPDGGIQVIDVTDPTNPTLKGSYDTDGDPRATFVEGDYIYVADMGGGLKIFDKYMDCEVVVSGDMCSRSGSVAVRAVDKDGVPVEETFYVECTCPDNYTGPSCDVTTCNGILSVDEDNVCSGHGDCEEFNVCQCDENYFGTDCEVTRCNYIWSNDTENVCSGGHGECNVLDQCTCQVGYYYSDQSFCGDWDCYTRHYSSACGSYGRCVSPDNCECDNGFHQDECDNWMCFGVFQDSSNVCNHGRGECVAPDKCVCEGNFGGDDCRYDNSLALGLSVSLPLISVTIFSCVVFSVLLCCLTTCFCVFLCCCGICTCGTLLLQRIKTQEKKIEKFKKLKDFDLLLTEQEMEEKDNYARLEVNKKLFTIEMDDIHTISILGEGGSNSVVFKAKWAGKMVAYKCFKTRTLMNSQDNYDEFEREVTILSSISHPNIIQFFGATLKPPRVGILMELCSKGEILDFILDFREKYLNQYPLPEKIRLIAEVCSALEYLHSRNVIHRDLKCENVLVNESTNAKLMDFGLSRVFDKMSVQKTQRVGTSVYMAPELVLSSDYDEKCDVFSVGIMIFVLFTENPHPYGNKDEFQIELKVANDPNFRPLMDKLDFLPGLYEEWMKELVSNCLQHDPQKRYSCKQIGEILEKRGNVDKEDIEVLEASSVRRGGSNSVVNKNEREEQLLATIEKLKNEFEILRVENAEMKQRELESKQQRKKAPPVPRKGSRKVKPPVPSSRPQATSRSNEQKII